MPYKCGFRSVELTLAGHDTKFPMIVMYPTQAAESIERVFPYSIEVARDAELAGSGKLPLVLISHGSGGSPMVYRTLAQYLARSGFVVGLPEHPHNNRRDNSYAGRVENLMHRPEHLRTAIDWFFSGQSGFADRVLPHVGVIGHSMGGYTALALAGGVPTTVLTEAEQPQHSHQISIERDARINAIVLLAPASVWFRQPHALDNVTQPVLLMFGEKDEDTPMSLHGRIITEGLPAATKLRQHVIPNAGHFSFLSPFPKASGADFAPALDPPGFDREKFMHELNAEVGNFLQENLL